jgi:hypothetical protein
MVFIYNINKHEIRNEEYEEMRKAVLLGIHHGLDLEL